MLTNAVLLAFRVYHVLYFTKSQACSQHDIEEIGDWEVCVHSGTNLNHSTHGVVQQGHVDLFYICSTITLNQHNDLQVHVVLMPRYTHCCGNHSVNNTSPNHIASNNCNFKFGLHVV